MAPPRKALHEDEDACKYILDNPAESTSLKIGESRIASLGSGLIANTNIAQGRQIFKSKPLIACVDPGLDTICHYCLKGSESAPLSETPTEQEPRPNVCSGCHVACFCSKACHSKAWKVFHKNECRILRDSAKLTMSHLALYRLLFWKKRNYITTETATVLSLLEDHFDEYSDTEAGDVLFEFASSIRNTANPDVALNVVLRLLPAIQINAIKMRQAEKGGSFGIALDLISCTVNHSCDPNAFLYVEGGHVICRSLRRIPLGEEVTVSYCDPMLPLKFRREYLSAEYFFNCFCKRCESDKRELNVMVGSNTGGLKALHEVQEMLVKLMNNTVAAAKRPGMFRHFENLEKMEMDILALTGQAVKQDKWPDHLDPMPLVRNTLARLYLNKQNYFPATRNALRGTLMCRNRNGPEWVNNLCTLTQCLAAIAAGKPDEACFTGGGFMTLKETQCAVRGCGMRLCKDAGAVFGGGSKYTHFLCDWFSWIVKTAEPPKPGSAEFEALFWEAQKKLLAWADVDLAYCVDPGSELPTAEDLSKRIGKLRVMGSIENLKPANDDEMQREKTGVAAEEGA